MPNIGPMEIGIVLVIALIVFGPKKLPDLGRSLGKGIREFKGSISGEDEPEVPSPPAAIEPPPAVDRERAPEATPAAKTPA
jgi:sec-independent protein translocase protein TatA